MSTRLTLSGAVELHNLKREAYRINWLLGGSYGPFPTLEAAGMAIRAEPKGSPVRAAYTYDEDGIVRDDEGIRRARIEEEAP